MKAAAELIEIRRSEAPDLIDRIANALPEETRAEYYKELRHCRSLPENDEMLRLLRAMQFLVLLIEQAPGRVAEERELLDKLLASTVATVSKLNAASEAWHIAVDRKLTALPADIAHGIRPEVVAAKINENLRQEFIRSTIPQTAEALAAISGQLKITSSEFTASANQIGHAYRGAAEDARKAVASLKSEISQATEAAERFTKEVAEKASKVYRWSLIMLGVGALIIGLAIGMLFERWLISPQVPAAAPTVTLAAPAVQSAPSPAARSEK
jgi:hypothetical protein